MQTAKNLLAANTFFDTASSLQLSLLNEGSQSPATTHQVVAKCTVFLSDTQLYHIQKGRQLSSVNVSIMPRNGWFKARLHLLHLLDLEAIFSLIMYNFNFWYCFVW